MRHAWQFQTLGAVKFYQEYYQDYSASKDANSMYNYTPGVTSFKSATLEAQAAIVENYTIADSSNNAKQGTLFLLNLKGSGIYGQ